MTTPVTYTLKEVNEHRGRESCWIIIDGKVYDVTKYLDKHPGGDRYIIDESGGNASEAFEGHSGDAREILETLLIGYLHPDEVELLARKDSSPDWSRITVATAVAVPVLAVAMIGAMIILNRK